jgi:hypothetical protein
MTKPSSKVRIFIGLTDIASIYSGLHQGFNELGVEAVFVPLDQNRYSRRLAGKPRHLTHSLVNWLLGLRARTGGNDRAAAIYDSSVFPLAKFILLVWAAWRFDVFIFGFATTFFGYRELPVLRFLGKKIIYVFNGSDSRPPFISGKFIRPEFGQTPADCAKAARTIKKNIRIIERYADICVNHPPQAQFHERKFINWCFIGIPCKLPIAPIDISDHNNSRTVRIVHAPTSPGPKGTEFIRALMSRLQGEGHAIQYIELIDRPNIEVLGELSRCDFVVDELYSDIPLAGLGTEAAFFGKPAVVGGYAQAELGPFAAQTKLPMQLYVEPEEVESVVRRLVVDEAFRKESGAIAQAFVSENWTSAKVAERFLRLIAGDVPQEWWHDPETITYAFGWGVSKATLRAYLARYVALEGIELLQMADKPALEAKLIELSHRGSSCEHDASDQRHVAAR